MMTPFDRLESVSIYRNMAVTLIEQSIVTRPYAISKKELIYKIYK